MKRLSIILVAGGLAVAGCASHGGHSNAAGTGTPSAATVPAGPLQAVSAAYQKTVDAKTSKFDLSVVVATSGGGSSSNITTSGRGAVDYAHHRSALVTQLPNGGSTEIRQIGKIVYLELPANLRQRAGGKPWVRLDLSQQSGGGSMGYHDPTQSLQLLRSAAKSVQRVGTETIRGTSTTHYRVQVDPAKAAAQHVLTGPNAEQLQQLLHGKPLPVDIWVDAAGRARQQRVTQPLPSPAGGSHGSVTLTIDLYDFGTPVSVTAPPANQVGTTPAPGLPAPSPTAAA